MNEKTVLTKAELAQYLSLCTASIDRAMKAEGLPFTKIGKRVIFQRYVVDEWLTKKRTILDHGKQKNKG